MTTTLAVKNKFETNANMDLAIRSSKKPLRNNPTVDCFNLWLANMINLQTFHANFNPFKNTHVYIQLNQGCGKKLEHGIKVVNLTICCPNAIVYGGILALERILVPPCIPIKAPKTQDMS